MTRRMIYPFAWFFLVALPGAVGALVLLIWFGGHWLHTGEWDEVILLRGDIEKRETWLRHWLLNVETDVTGL